MPTNTPSIVAPVSGGISPYRLLVRAVDNPRRKGFVWEIFSMDYGQRSIERSPTAFKSMAEAHDDGTVALGRLNSRMTKRREVLNLHATRMRPTIRPNGRGPLLRHA